LLRAMRCHVNDSISDSPGELARQDRH
jgi:hypothetical protein